MNLPRPEIEAALALDEEEFTAKYNHAKPKVGDRIIIYCQDGYWGTLSLKAFRQEGFTNAVHFPGAAGRWQCLKEQGFCPEEVTDRKLSETCAILSSEPQPEPEPTSAGVHPCWLRMPPCMYRGKCIPDGDDYTCECPEGYSGKDCEIPPPTPTQPALHICDQQRDVCNGGLCLRDGDSYRCACTRFCSGPNCNNCFTRPTMITPRRPITIAPSSAPRQCFGGKFYSSTRVCQRECGRSIKRCSKGCVCPDSKWLLTGHGRTRCVDTCPPKRPQRIKFRFG